MIFQEQKEQINAKITHQQFEKKKFDIELEERFKHAKRNSSIENQLKEEARRKKELYRQSLNNQV